jgi:hypothetical protein
MRRTSSRSLLEYEKKMSATAYIRTLGRLKFYHLIENRAIHRGSYSPRFLPTSLARALKSLATGFGKTGTVKEIDAFFASSRKR